MKTNKRIKAWAVGRWVAGLAMRRRAKDLLSYTMYARSTGYGLAHACGGLTPRGAFLAKRHLQNVERIERIASGKKPFVVPVSITVEEEK